MITALQVANIDFFADDSVSRLWVAKEHATGHYLKLVKKFLDARMRFVYKHYKEKKKLDDAMQKKIDSLDSVVFHQSSALIDVYGECK